MERSEILAAMAELKLNGMKAAYDEIIAVAVKRQYEPQTVVAELLKAEFAEKKAALSVRLFTSESAPTWRAEKMCSGYGLARPRAQSTGWGC